MMNILIIGSEGFIGKHCVNHFIAKGCNVYGCDLLDVYNTNYKYYKISRISFDFEDIMHKNKYDLCINAAGNGSVPISVEYPLLDFEANTIDTFHILEGLRKYNSDCKFLFISSAAVYGNPIELPIREDSDISPISPYGWHKYYSELICKEYSSLYNVRSCGIRPFSVYGPGLKKQLLWDLHQKFSINDNVIELFGTGTETRDFIYIDDLIQIIDHIFYKGEFNGECYNVADGIETSISEVARIFKNILNWEGEIRFTGSVRSGDPLNWRADISKIKKLEYSSEHTLVQGIKKYVEWISEKK